VCCNPAKIADGRNDSTSLPINKRRKFARAAHASIANAADFISIGLRSIIRKKSSTCGSRFR
jgi:hypothetical protein